MEFSGYSRRELQTIIESVGELPPGKCAIDVYDQESGSVIRRVLSRRTALRLDLNALAEIAVTRRWQVKVDKLTPLKLARRFDLISSAARRLLEAVEAEPDGDIDKIPEQYLYGRLAKAAGTDNAELRRISGLRSDLPGRAMLLISLKHVAYVRKWAEEAREAALTEGARGRADRHRGDFVLRDHVESLIEVYSRVFERTPGTTVAGRTVDGPLVRFIQTCLTPLWGEDTLSPAAIRSLVRDLASPKSKSEKI